MKLATLILTGIVCIFFLSFKKDIQPELIWDCYAETNTLKSTDVFLAVVGATSKKEAEVIFDRWILSFKKGGKIIKDKNNYAVVPIVDGHIMRK